MHTHSDALAIIPSKYFIRTPFDIFDIFGHYWTSGIVPAYSKCRLTYASDKLLAVSGLAKEMVQLMHEGSLAPDEYVAILHMLWQINFDKKPRQNSLMRVLGLGLQSKAKLITAMVSLIRLQVWANVVAIEMIYVSEDPFGLGKPGIVHVRAPLRKHTLQLWKFVLATQLKKLTPMVSALDSLRHPI